MEVILKKDVKGTGKEGDIVKVSDGFARNKLIPGGFAVEATEANKRAIAREKAKAAEKYAADKAAAEAQAKQLTAAPVVVKTKVEQVDSTSKASRAVRSDEYARYAGYSFFRISLTFCGSSWSSSVLWKSSMINFAM